MKALPTNFSTKQQEIKQSYELRGWAMRMGLSAKDFENKLESHPFISDVRLLIDLNMYKHFFNRKDTQVFNHIWNQVYQLEYPLSVYHKKKLQQVLISAEYTKKKLQAVNEKNDHKEE